MNKNSASDCASLTRVMHATFQLSFGKADICERFNEKSDYFGEFSSFNSLFPRRKPEQLFMEERITEDIVSDIKYPAELSHDNLPSTRSNIELSRRYKGIFNIIKMERTIWDYSK
jgi:hypothetical protein